MLRVSPKITIPAAELEFSAIRAQGAGGQNVNKVATAVHLRFDIAQSQALPDDVRHRLLALHDQRISSDGVAVIKSQRYRSQTRNKEDALDKLKDLIRQATVTKARRVPTRPPKSADRKRLEQKAHRSEIKQHRKVDDA